MVSQCFCDRICKFFPRKVLGWEENLILKNGGPWYVAKLLLLCGSLVPIADKDSSPLVICASFSSWCHFQWNEVKWNWFWSPGSWKANGLKYFRVVSKPANFVGWWSAVALESMVVSSTIHICISENLWGGGNLVSFLRDGKSSTNLYQIWFMTSTIGGTLKTCPSPVCC